MRNTVDICNNLTDIDAMMSRIECSAGTWIDAEMVCSDIGQFRRRGKVRHCKTGQLVSVLGAIPDTYFSIPATTKTEHGYVTSADDGALEFRPHTEQTQSPAEYRKEYRRACR